MSNCTALLVMYFSSFDKYTEECLHSLTDDSYIVKLKSKNEKCHKSNLYNFTDAIKKKTQYFEQKFNEKYK
jgi:hypothetical protein